MEFDEETIKKIKNKLEFDKTKSELLIEFISKMGKISDDLKLHLNEIMKNSYKIKSIVKDQFDLFEVGSNYNKNLHCKEVIAIDGSSNIGGQLTGKFVCLYSVARIHLLIDDQNNIIPSDYYWGDMDIIDALDELEINKKLEVKMLQKETEAYGNSLSLFNNANSNKKIIFVDGPTIDPPTYNDINYVKFRCDTIKSLLDKNIIIIGCVKRIFGTHFCNYLSDLIKDESFKKKIELYLNDSYLISSMVADYRKQNNYHGPIISNFYENTSKIDQTTEEYHNNGISIKSLFFQFSTKHNLIRVDLPFLKNKDLKNLDFIEFIKTNLVEWSYPGIDVPYPVYLAHEFSKIRNGCAQKIYDDIISKNLSSKPISQLLINMLK